MKHSVFIVVAVLSLSSIFIAHANEEVFSLSTSSLPTGCHKAFRDVHSGNLIWRSESRCCTPGIVPDGIRYGGKWCQKPVLNSGSSCKMKLDPSPGSAAFVEGVQWDCDSPAPDLNLSACSAGATPWVEEMDSGLVQQVAKTLGVDANHLVASPPGVGVGVASAPPSPSSARQDAAADEYFGYSHVSAEKIGLDLKYLDSKVKQEGWENAQQLYNGLWLNAHWVLGLKALASGVTELVRLYPHDRDVGLFKKELRDLYNACISDEDPSHADSLAACRAGQAQLQAAAVSSGSASATTPRSQPH